MKKFLCFPLLVFVLIFLSGCKDMTFYGDWKGYLEYHSTSAILSKHEVQGESYEDSSGRLTVPSHKDAVVILYTTNPKNFILLPDFTVETTSDVPLSKGTVDAYGIKIEHDSADRSLYTATIPQDLLQELDLSGSGLSFSITPKESTTGRIMPSYGFKIQSNTRPAFGSNSAVIMQTKSPVDGSKKWVLCFDLPDLSGVHQDIDAIEINDVRYKVDTTQQGGSALTASVGSGKLSSFDQLEVGTGVAFVTSNKDQAVYLITDDTIGTARTYTVSLIDKAGLVASLPPVSTTDTAYGKEIVSFVFEASNNPQIVAAGIQGDMAGQIDGATISFTSPSALTDKLLTPTITLSGGTVSPASGTQQDFSQPVIYTVTAGDGTTRSYTVSLEQFLPKPQLDTEPGTINSASVTIKPTNWLPQGTTLHYTVNGGQVQTVDPTQGIQLLVAVDAPYEIDCWFQCDGYTDSNHFAGTYRVELSPAAIIATVRSKDTAAQANETTVDGSRTTTFTHNFDGYGGSIVEFSCASPDITLKVDGQVAKDSYDIAPSKTIAYTVTAYNRQGGLAAAPVTFTITSSRKMPKPVLSDDSSSSSGGTYTLHYPVTELTMTVDTTGLPSGTVLFYDLNGQQQTLDLSTQPSFTIPVGSGHKLSYLLHCGGYEDSEPVSISNFTVESKLPTPQLTPSEAESSGKYTVNYPDTSITLSQSGVQLPNGTNLTYTYGNQTKSALVSNGSVTITLEKGTYDNFTYLYECSGFTSSDTARLGSFSVVSKLPKPVLNPSDGSTAGVWQSSNSTYYTTTGSVTVKANAANVPSGTTLKYTVTSTSGTSSKTVTPNSSTTITTLDIQGSAYTVTAWYECSGYETSATTQQDIKVWLHRQKIVLTATSRNAHADGTQTANGSSPTLNHNFYGVTGSSFTFSVDSSQVKKANGSSYSFSTSDDSTFTLEHGGSTSKTVYATLNGQPVSDTVTFSASSTMRPITFTFGGQGRVGVQIWWTNKTYDQQPVGWTRVNQNDLWSYWDKNWTISKNNRDIHTVTSALTEQQVTVNSPTTVLTFDGFMRETAGSDVDYKEVANTVTAATLYNNRTETWPHKLESSGEYTYYYKFSYVQ